MFYWILDVKPTMVCCFLLVVLRRPYFCNYRGMYWEISCFFFEKTIKCLILKDCFDEIGGHEGGEHDNLELELCILHWFLLAAYGQRAILIPLQYYV